MRMYVLQDVRSGLFFNRESYRHHGTWMTHTAYAPLFETEDQALAFARVVGMTPGTVRPVAVTGTGGALFDGGASFEHAHNWSLDY